MLDLMTVAKSIASVVTLITSVNGCKTQVIPSQNFDLEQFFSIVSFCLPQV